MGKTLLTNLSLPATMAANCVGMVLALISIAWMIAGKFFYIIYQLDWLAMSYRHRYVATSCFGHFSFTSLFRIAEMAVSTYEFT